MGQEYMNFAIQTGPVDRDRSGKPLFKGMSFGPVTIAGSEYI